MFTEAQAIDWLERGVDQLVFAELRARLVVNRVGHVLQLGQGHRFSM